MFQLDHLGQYEDTGCELHPACLTCPLPRCRYDEPDDGRNMLKRLRNEVVINVFQKELLAVQELAQRFNLSKRTVHRILQARGSRVANQSATG